MNTKSVTYHISAGSVAKAALVLIGFWLLWFLRDLALILLASVVIASAIEPAARWFSRYHIPRLLAVIIVYFLLISVIVGLFYLFIPILAAELSRLSAALPEYLEILRNINPLESLGISQAGEAGAITQSITQQVVPVSEGISTLKNTLNSYSGNVLSGASAVFGGVVSLLLIFVISFYLAVQERGIENFLRVIVPTRHEEYIISLWKRSRDKIGKWIQGQLLLGLLIGIVVYLGLTVLQVPYAFSLAVLAVVMELIPLFGPIIAAIPAVILGFLESTTLGLIVIGFYVIVQQFENHLIYPLIVRKVVGVHPIMVIVALIVGGKLAGFLGVLLSVPVAAAGLEFMNDLAEEKRKQHKALKAQGKE